MAGSPARARGCPFPSEPPPLFFDNFAGYTPGSLAGQGPWPWTHFTTHDLTVDTVPSAAADQGTNFCTEWAPVAGINLAAASVTTAKILREVSGDAAGSAVFGISTNSTPWGCALAWSAGDSAANQVTLVSLTDSAGTVIATAGPVAWPAGIVHTVSVNFDGSMASIAIDGVTVIAATAIGAPSLAGYQLRGQEGSGGDLLHFKEVSISQ